MFKKMNFNFKFFFNLIFNINSHNFFPEFYRKYRERLKNNKIEINDDLKFEAGLSDFTDIDVMYIWKALNQHLITKETLTKDEINELLQGIKSSNTEYMKAEIIEQFMIYWNSSSYSDRVKMTTENAAFNKSISDMAKKF
ncbi:hypothetical protein QMA88_00620 [Mycoplasma sp. M6642]|nr:hypothetical protein [Mycoplasma phocimorsus]